MYRLLFPVFLCRQCICRNNEKKKKSYQKLIFTKLREIDFSVFIFLVEWYHRSPWGIAYFICSPMNCFEETSREAASSTRNVALWWSLNTVIANTINLKAPTCPIEVYRTRFIIVQQYVFSINPFHTNKWGSRHGVIGIATSLRLSNPTIILGLLQRSSLNRNH